MKKFTKILCLAMTLVMCVAAMSACGSKLFADADDTFCIGATGPLTGDNSSYGISVQRGAQIAIDEINAAGGLNGHKFSFEMLDDVAAADKAATGYTSLYEAGMQISIGSVTSGACKSFADAAKADNVLLLTPSASADNVINAGDHAFRVCFGDPQQGDLAADALVEAGYAKIGVIYDTSDPYSDGIYKAFIARMTALEEAENTHYVVKSFDSDNNKDFATQVTDLKNAGCDVLFLPFYYTQAGLVAKNAASIGYNVPIFGCDGLDGIKGQLDDTVTANIKYITPFDVNSTDAKVTAFVNAYKAKYNNETPDQFAADGYDAVMILFEAMKAANVTDVNISASDLTNAVKAVLTNGTFRYTGVTGIDMTWDATGSCNKKPNIVEVAR